MSAPKFTPGPWSVNPICNGDYLDIVSDRGEGTDRVLFSIDSDRPNAEANADLVAAAPLLAETLREAIELMPLGTRKRAEWLVRASAALAKAVQ